MINQNFFSLAEAECGVSIVFDEIRLDTRQEPLLDATGNAVTDDNNNPILVTIEPTFSLTDKSAVILEYEIADAYPEDTIVEIVPKAYVIQKPIQFIPQTTVIVKPKYDFGAQILLQLNIKNLSGDIIYTDYQIIVVGDSQQRNCQKADRNNVESEDIILNRANLWEYIYNDHTIVKMNLIDSGVNNDAIIGKLQKKSKDVLPVRLQSEDIDCAQTSTGGTTGGTTDDTSGGDTTGGSTTTSQEVCNSKQIAAIPSVAMVKRVAADSKHKIAELIYNKNVYDDTDTLRVNVSNSHMSGVISDNIIYISGDYFAQHLLSYSHDQIENSVSYTNIDNDDPEYTKGIEEEFLIFDNVDYSSNNFIAYSTGVYRWDTSAINLPIAILNKGNEDKISYSGVPSRSITIPGDVLPDNNPDHYVPNKYAGTYDFIKGVMEITVKEGVDDDFLSFYVLNYGYMGGADKLVFAKEYIPTPTPTPSPTVTPSITPTISLTPSVTPSATSTPTLTVSISPTMSVTPTLTASITPTVSVSPTITPTISVTPSITPTISVTPSNTATPSPTPTITPSQTQTQTCTPTITTTPSITVSNTPTITLTPTISLTPSITPTITSTPTTTPTPTQTPGVPSAVLNLEATRDFLDTTITSTWSEPLNDGGSPITGYVFEYKKLSDVNYVTIELASDNNSYTFDTSPDITDTWNIRVKAVNINGDGVSTILQIT